MHFVGVPKTAATQVESFITMRLNNLTLEDFYQKIASATRSSDVVLNEPSTMSIAWKLAVPEGYTVQQCLENTTLGGPCGMTGRVSVTRSATAVDVSMDVQFPIVLIPQPSFKEMVGFLEKVRGVVGKDIVLRKL